MHSDKTQLLPHLKHIKLFYLFVLAFMVFALQGNAIAQPKSDTLNISQLVKLLQSGGDNVEISNATIVFDPSVDRQFAQNKIFYRIIYLKPVDKRPKKIFFYDCTFNTGKNAPLVFDNWVFGKINIAGCSFNNVLRFENCKQSGNYPILLENNTFKKELLISGSDSLKRLQINKCLFESKAIIGTTLKEFSIENSKFIVDSSNFNTRHAGKTEYQLCLNNIKTEEINLVDCHFSNENFPNVFSIDFGGTEIEKLTILNTQTNAISFGDTKVENAILIDSLSVSDYINVRNFDFPETNTNIPWYNLGGEKLAIFDVARSEQIIPYQAKTEKQLMNTLYYNDLISAYNKFNTLYHDRGDLRSANRSYVEIKTLETRMQKHLLANDWDFNVYLNYKLNVFLSFFSDFATNPGKSLIQSLWVLLAFTVLYMISFSEWDGMNYSYYLLQYRLFSAYITTDSSINEVYGKRKNPHRNLMKKIRKKYNLSGKEIPRTLKFFGKPLHFLGKFRYEVVPNLLRLFNFQGKSWESLQPSEKVYSTFLIILIMISFGIYVVVVKFINAFILSLNSFVVIGFGMLPEKGLAMYLSIIEGIIGWFLLTIFTITLLSQVLQNA